MVAMQALSRGLGNAEAEVEMLKLRYLGLGVRMEWKMM
jgi:hypothetical protein